MSARAGRRILLLLMFFASVALFAVPASEAMAKERSTVTVVSGPAMPRTVPVSTTRAIIRPASRPMTASQLAATHGLTYRDAGTYALLERGTLRVRIYPNMSTVVIAGREYRVKDPALRSQRAIVLSRRVAGFLNHKIAAYRADERMRKRIQKTPRPRYAPLPPLPPKPVRRKPIVKPVLKPKPIEMQPASDAPPVAGRGWVPPVTPRNWKWIVLHHSDDLRGNMQKYDDYHRNEKRWEHGCGYHFVIGNGTLSGDGEVEIGPRWTRQLHGAHAKTPDNRFNDYGVGICLVGKFNEGRPTKAQMDSLVNLVRWLKARYDIDIGNVKGHCHCCVTDCPGKNFPWAELRRRLR
ncbi:MAG: N-acetylmuramoyl-L-alanine amidase [Planctomycetota bacterium]|nr:N-acetylmuramoyl-L-alanine amidase [Planctomycetota bacterium]